MMSVPMFGLVLALVFAGGVAQCPPYTGGGPSATTTPGPDSDPTSCGGSGDGDQCQQVNVINRTILDAFCEQPIYYTFFPNKGKYAQIDNVCVALFPVRDNSHTLIYYYSIIFTNGSNSFETYVISTNAPGINRYAGIDNTFTEYIIGEDCCGGYVIYSCGDSEEGNVPYVYGTNTDCNSLPYSEECLQSAMEVIKSAGLPVGEYISLPNQLTKACPNKHLCLPKSNPLYESQGGSCEPYEGSDCQC